MPELEIVVWLGSDLFVDSDDVPMLNEGIFRHFGSGELAEIGAVDADDELVNERHWMVFNREPRDIREITQAIRRYRGDDA